MIQPVVDTTQMLPDLTAAELIHLGDQSVQELTVVADDDGRAVESLDGLFQHVLRGHVQVVGRLVEYQQVHRFQQQTYHGQTTAFAAAEHLDTLVTLLAAKHESTQNGIDAHTDFTFGHIVNRLKHRQALVQQLCLILSKIAYLHVMANLQISLKGYLVHDTLHERRLTFTVFAHESHLLTTLNGQVDVVEDEVVVSLPHLIANHRIVTRTQTGRELQVHGRVVHLVNLNGHYLFQLLHLLLHLHGLGSLITETFNKLLHVGNLLLLVLVGSQLLFTTLLAQNNILVVLHLVVDDPSARNLQRTVCHIIDKRTVVTHQHHGTARLRQKLFQPLDGLNVQMVRRLVQQQHIRTLQQYLGQLNTHAPATTELTRGTLQVATLKAKPRQRTLQFCLARLGTHHQQTLVLLRITFHKSHVIVTLVVRPFIHLTFQTGDALL